MKTNFYKQITSIALAGKPVSRKDCCKILESNDIDTLPLLNAAYSVRKKYFGKDVLIHIIDNLENGLCSEDCFYCAQSTSSKAKIDRYRMKSDAQILKEAKDAYLAGAFRHCLVFSGKRPSLERITHLSAIVRKIKKRFPIMEVCVSPGMLTAEQAKLLKKAGCNRINHNINTTEKHYSKICTTHDYSDRIRTISVVRAAGLDLCSGVIIGMGETVEDIIIMAQTLQKYKVKSIPVNFLIPIEGIKLKKTNSLTPEFCLKVLCLFRFLNPKAEIRVAAGREFHLRSLEALALYPANSLFLDGYLNAEGAARYQTLRMIHDAGFAIKTDHALDRLISNEIAKITKIKQSHSIKLKKSCNLKSNF